jgi:hypothetical protein
MRLARPDQEFEGSALLRRPAGIGAPAGHPVVQPLLPAFTHRQPCRGKGR